MAEDVDELLEVGRRLACLDRIGLLARRILCRDDPLLERDRLCRRRVVPAPASCGRDGCQNHKECYREPHGTSILRSAGAIHNATVPAALQR
jgi:hypothetical protein